MRETIPLRERPIDVAFVVFFVANLLFVTYLIDLEQLVIKDPRSFEYPPWPPAAVIDVLHAYGAQYDPLLMARPVWWQVAIWWDALFFGPFYLVAIPAYVGGKEWIRIPSIVYASVLLTILSMILSEEAFGPHATEHLPFVMALNAPWVIMPLCILLRMSLRAHPFTRKFRVGGDRDQWSM